MTVVKYFGGPKLYLKSQTLNKNEKNMPSRQTPVDFLVLELVFVDHVGGAEAALVLVEIRLFQAGIHW